MSKNIKIYHAFCIDIRMDLAPSVYLFFISKVTLKHPNLHVENIVLCKVVLSKKYLVTVNSQQ